MDQEERNSKTLKVTVIITVFLFIAGLLTMAYMLHPTTPIFKASIASKMAFAQEQKKMPIEIIAKLSSLLNQAINEYRNRNFTGAQGLASSAYLDNFEFLESPLDKHDKALRNDTEIMLREQLRQVIKDKSPMENIQQLINKINSNLDKALLANQSPILTMTSSAEASSSTIKLASQQLLRPSLPMRQK